MFNLVSSFFTGGSNKGSLEPIDLPPHSVETRLGVISHLNSKCDQQQLMNAEEILEIHNVIEEVAYKAFAEKVSEMGLKGDAITDQQSGEILAHIKKKAHIEMFRKNGYMALRTKLLKQEQVAKVVQNVGKIIHDRDTKLTDGCYHSLSELLMGLDDHNTMVKEILIESWFQLPDFSDKDHSHLENIKKRVCFYQSLGNLEFNLKAALEERKAFWNQHFPGKREADEKKCSITLSASESFMNIMEVRHRFKKMVSLSLDQSNQSDVTFCTQDAPQRSYSFSQEQLNQELSLLLSDEEGEQLFEAQKVSNQVRCQEMQASPLIKDKGIFLKDFLARYFPEASF